MIVLGLTGSIASGKSTVSGMFSYHGIPAFDADAAVRQLLQPESSVFSSVISTFPTIKSTSGIDRNKLRNIVFNDISALKELESILHPHVQEAEMMFRQKNIMENNDIVLCDIPLLFETRAQERYDHTILVSAPPVMQRRRATARPGIDDDVYEKILARQMSVELKRKLADSEIHTGLGMAYSMRQVMELLAKLRRKTHA